jgi:putative tryptophan/tyrosine transport system substrate-binding protein
MVNSISCNLTLAGRGRMPLDQLKRRDFITLLGGAAAAWPLAARAQQPRKTPTVGLLGATTPAVAGQWIAAFAQRLHELGWTEGRTVAIEYRFAEGRNERMAEIVAEFVKARADVIVAQGTQAALTAKNATAVIPIVFVLRATPSEAGWLRAWHAPAAMSPGFRVRQPTLAASASISCARSSRGCAGWQ